MNIFDRLPHRQLINRSLRKNAELVRCDIDAYQKQYDEQYQKATDELQTAKNEYAAKLKRAKEDVLEKLATENESIQALSNSIVEYITAFFNKQLLLKQKDLVQLQIDNVNQYIGFLSEQMHLLGEENKHLEARKNLLVQQAEIADIRQLIQLSGNQLAVDESVDAKALFELVMEKMNRLDDNDRLQRNVLLNVRTLLEERVSFLTEIQYITWTIAQKIQLSKELRSIREKQKQVKDKLNKDLDGLLEKIKKLDSVLFEKAREIRFYWAKRLVGLSLEIENAKGKKSDLIESVKAKKEERSIIQNDINWMKSTHSDDNWKWEQLQSEKKDLSDEIQRLSSGIDSVKRDISKAMYERKTWQRSRGDFLKLLNSLDVFLMFIGQKEQTDEDIYVEFRVQELEALDAEGKVEAERVYHAELAAIEAEKKSALQTKTEEIQDISTRLESARSDLKVAGDSLEKANKKASEEENERLKKLEEQDSCVNSDLIAASENLERAKAEDHRFVLVKVFSDTEAVTKARNEVAAVKRRKERIEAAKTATQDILKTENYSGYQYVQTAQESVEACEKILESIKQELKDARENYDQTDASYNKKIRSLHPHQEKPNRKERSELRDLQTWQKSQRKGKEQKNESKN